MIWEAELAQLSATEVMGGGRGEVEWESPVEWAAGEEGWCRRKEEECSSAEASLRVVLRLEGVLAMMLAGLMPLPSAGAEEGTMVWWEWGW